MIARRWVGGAVTVSGCTFRGLETRAGRCDDDRKRLTGRMEAEVKAERKLTMVVLGGQRRVY